MSIQTKESRFQYQAHHILKQFHKDYEEERQGIEENDDQSFDDYLWDNKAELGAKFLEAIEQWCGVDEALRSEY